MRRPSAQIVLQQPCDHLLAYVLERESGAQRRVEQPHIANGRERHCGRRWIVVIVGGIARVEAGERGDADSLALFCSQLREELKQPRAHVAHVELGPRGELGGGEAREGLGDVEAAVRSVRAQQSLLKWHGAAATACGDVAHRRDQPCGAGGLRAFLQVGV
eukprot:scaffold325519_cov54-Tisochrysis_lutea.AAC.1